LGAAGLVSSQRGAGGGYRLARPAAQITVAQVFMAIEGPLRLALCCDEQEDEPTCTACQLMQNCPLEDSIRKLNEAMFDILRTVTLEDLLRDRLPGRPRRAAELEPAALVSLAVR
jgi:Rrf2 family protein